MDSDWGCAIFLAIGAVVWLVVVLVRLRRRVKQLEEAVESHNYANQSFGDNLAELRREIRLGKTTGLGSDVAETASAGAPPARPVPEKPVERPFVASQAPLPPAAAQAAAIPALPPLTPRTVPAEEKAAAPVPPVAPRRPTPPPIPPEPRRPAIDWESFVGVKLFSWIAGIALVFAAVLFLRYSIDHGWLRPPIRMAIGFLTGSTLLALCEWKVARRYAVTANALDAAGIAILFATSFAAHSLWHLIGGTAAFALMIVVTAAAVGLSIRRDSLFIAMLGLLGGFSTPALLSTGEDHPIGLFAYLLLLNAGLCWVARRKRWAGLTAVSFALTALYEIGWIAKFLTPDRLPLALAIIAVFPVLAVFALSTGEKPRRVLFDRTASAVAALPLLFGLYVSAVPAYGHHYGILFGFLFCLAVGLALLAKIRGPAELHALGGASALVIFATWLANGYQPSAWPAVLAIAFGFVLFYALFPFLRDRIAGKREEGAERLGDLTAAFLLFVFPVLAAIEPKSASPGLLFGVLFALLALLGVVALARESGVMHFVSAFFALAAEAVWSAKHLTPGHLLSALTIYAGFALLFLGVPLLAERFKRALKPEGSGAIVLFASLAMLFFVAAGPVAATAIWGLATILSILNVGLIFEAVRGHRPLLCLAGLALSWILIGTWWATVSVAVLLVPALVLVAGFALLVAGGGVLLGRRGEAGGIAGQGLYLALVGHLFLLLVAVQKPLAVPPWPFFGVLAVLDLAIAVASIASRRPKLHTSAVVASQVILMAWLTVAETAPWPTVAAIAMIAVAVFSDVWRWVARRAGREEAPYSGAAAAGIVLAQIGTIAVSLLAGRPGVPALLLFHVVLIALLLGLARETGWHVLAIVGLVPASAAVFLWEAAWFKPPLWRQEMLFATPIYLLFVAYPLILGRRAEKAIEPYLAAVLAGAPYFFLARHALTAGGYAGVIGALPLAQAGLTAILLWRLLRLEPAGRRMLNRLALVSGAALAFVTVAIPLQLDREWITIAWALQGAALAWLYRKIPHRGLLLWSAGLAATVFVRLAFNSAVWTYHARSALAVWNWYLYTYLVPAAALFLAAKFFADTDDRFAAGRMRLSWLYAGAATVLTFLLVNVEVADYYSKGNSLTFNFLSASLAQDLSYTISWACFAIVLLASGIVMRSRAARLAAIALLAVTIAKCFLHDLSRLGGLYRVASFVGLAVALALVAVLIQRFVLSPHGEREKGAA